MTTAVEDTFKAIRQACSASKRLIVHRSLHDQLAAKLVDAVQAQRHGAATDPESTVGPLIHARAAKKVAGQVANARSQGAEIAAGGGSSAGTSRIFRDVRPLRCTVTVA